MITQEKINNVLEWADEKGILSGATPLTQIDKTEEGLKETRDALVQISKVKKTDPYEDLVETKEKAIKSLQDEVKDGIGDMLVTIIILSDLCGTNMAECLDMAYDEIKDRTGKMINGTFVKDADLPDIQPDLLKFLNSGEVVV